jgi:hypothetical protein
VNGRSNARRQLQFNCRHSRATFAPLRRALTTFAFQFSGSTVNPRIYEVLPLNLHMAQSQREVA